MKRKWLGISVVLSVATVAVAVAALALSASSRGNRWEEMRDAVPHSYLAARYQMVNLLQLSDEAVSKAYKTRDATGIKRYMNLDEYRDTIEWLTKSIEKGHTVVGHDHLSGVRVIEIEDDGTAVAVTVLFCLTWIDERLLDKDGVDITNPDRDMQGDFQVTGFFSANKRVLGTWMRWEDGDACTPTPRGLE